MKFPAPAALAAVLLLTACGGTEDAAAPDTTGASNAAGDLVLLFEEHFERFMAIPGQALAYKVGQLKIRDIRKRAEARLGERFDMRRFHTEVLRDGAMPLSMLDAKIDRWVAAQLQET